MARQIQRYGEPGYPQPATVIRTQATTTSYVVMSGGVNAYGRQATFDIFTRDQTDRGLRVTIERGTGRNGADANGYAVTLIDGSNTSAVLNDTARTVALTVTGLTTGFNTLKAQIDGVSGLSSVYFGGAVASERPELGSTVSANGEDGSPRKARFRVNDGAVFLFFGSAAPANDAGSALVVGRAPPWQGYLPADAQVYIKHIGSTARSLSAEVFD